MEMEVASGRTVAIIAMMCNGQVLRSIRGSFLFTVLYALGVKSIFHHLNSSALSFQPDAPTCKYILYYTMPCHVMPCRIEQYLHTRHMHTTYSHFLPFFLSCVLSSVQFCILTTSISFIATLYIRASDL